MRSAVVTTVVTSVAVAVGAVIGTSARWSLGELLTVDGFPWATLLVNVVGCAVAGWCAVAVARRTTAWYFVVTGCLGGFTTASAFAVETRQLLHDGRPAAAAVYLMASVGFGLAAVALARTLTLRSAVS